MKSLRVSLLVLVVLVVAAVLPAQAGAAGPTVLGGEGRVLYTGKIKGGSKLEILVNPATDHVSHMFFETRKVMRCRGGYDWDVGLWQTTFSLGSGRHAVKRQRSIATNGLMTWDLRFAKDWKTGTLRVSDRYDHNYLGHCSGHFTAKLVRSSTSGTWQLGHYTGTTSQGSAVSLSAAWRRERGFTIPDFFVRDLTATVTFPCTTGPVTATLVPQTSGLEGGRLSVESTPAGGRFSATLAPAGGGQLTAEIEGGLSRSSATGALRLGGECPGEGYLEGVTELPFTASLTG